MYQRSVVIQVSLPEKKVSRDGNYWATILLLSPLVLQRLFIGGTSGGYDNYSGYSFAWAGYIVHIAFIFALFLRKPINKNNNIYTIIIFFALSMAQAYYVSTIFTGNFFSIIIVLIRAIIWILALYSYSNLFFEKKSFKKAFYEIIFVSGLFIIFCGIIYNIFDIPLGVNIEKGLGRVHGAYSEPSTLASVFPAFTIIAVLQRKYIGVVIGLIAIYGAASVVVTASFFIMIIVYLLVKYYRPTRVLIYGIILFAIAMTLSLNADVVNGLDQWSTVVTKFLDGTIGDSAFRTYTIDRVLVSIQDLATSVNYSTNIKLEDSGSLARLIGSVTMLKNMEVDGTTWFGYGLSVYGFVANALYGTALDFGFYPYLVSSFGILFGTILMLILTSRVLQWQNDDRIIYIIFAGGLVGTVYNSGGGLIAYSVVALSVFVPKPVSSVKRTKWFSLGGVRT